MSKIYKLIDPTSKRTKYVGFTNKTLKERLTLHLSHSKKNKTYVQRWIYSLSIPPSIELIEECDETVWQERERYWIKYYIEQGEKLCNLTSGGEGTPNMKQSNEFKQKLSERNKKMGIKPPVRNKPHSEETKKKMSESAKGRIIGFEQKKKMSQAKLGKYKGIKSYRAKKIYAFKLDNSFYKEYGSISTACHELNTSSGNICRSIKNNKTCRNLKWSYDRNKFENISKDCS